MKSDAIKKIFLKFLKKKITFKHWVVLEFFARDGSYHTNDYNNNVKKIIAWEINRKFKKDFKKNVKNSKFIVGDSFKLSKKNFFFNQFNLIVIDNPQYIYGSNKEYCEHFEAIENLKNLFKEKKCFLIFNINKKPYGYNKLKDWKSRRQKFYGQNIDTSKISSKEMNLFYKQKFKKLGYNVLDCFQQKRNNFLSYMVMILNKKT